MGNARLYRLENASGWGPYNGSFNRTHDVEVFIHNRQKNLTHQPSVKTDVKYFKPGMFSAFKSEKQFLTWFDEPHVLADLYRAGFSLVVYTVPKELVRYGKRQVAFYAADATKRVVLRQGAHQIPIVNEDEDVYFSTKEPLVKTYSQLVSDAVEKMRGANPKGMTQNAIEAAARTFVYMNKIRNIPTWMN